MKRKLLNGFIPAVLALFATALPVRAELPLAVDGARCSVIVCAADAAPGVRFAAEELQRYLWEITGACPYLRTHRFGAKTTILLGCPGSWGGVNPAAFKKDLEQIGDTDGYAVRRKGRDLYIVANNPKGVLNGVYDFLERNTDIIFYRPSAPAIYGKNPNLKAMHTDFLEVPAFVERGFQINIDDQYEPSELWLARNRNNLLGNTQAPFRDMRTKYGMVRSFGGGHNLALWIPAKKYAESNPDFFPLIDGKRKTAGGIQRCFTNPKLVEEMSKRVLEEVAKAPSPDYYRTYNIMTEDCLGLCECPECLKPITLPDGSILKPEDPAFRSTQHFIFMNKVTENVTKVYPNVFINCYAYMWTVTPSKVKLHPHLTARFCTSVKNDKESINGLSNKKWLEMAQEWAKVAPTLVWREYYGLAADFCRPVAEVVADDLKTIHKLGITRAFSEAAFNENPDRNEHHYPFDVSGMEYWVISRLYWQPDADVGKLRDEYLKRTYREAFEPMKTFFDAIRKSWYDSPKSSTYLDSALKSADYYIVQAGIEKQCRDSLIEAEKRVKHPESLKQIQAVRKVFEYWMSEAPKMRTPEITVPRIKSAADMAKVPWLIDGLNIMTTPDPAQFKTRIKMGHDFKNLYVEFYCENPKSADIVGIKPPQLPDTWPTGEHIEFFLDGSRAADGGYYLFAFNAFGVKYDAVGMNAGWNGKWDLKTEIKDGYWIAFLTLPLETIGVNVTQQSKLNGTFYKQTNTKGLKYEGASWGGAGLHAPAGFGQFIFAWD